LFYFAAAYIAKCYLNEPNAHLVRQFAYQASVLSSCEIARVEFYAVVQRHLREGNINSQEAQEVLKDFEKDEIDGIWQWFPVTSALFRQVCQRVNGLPNTAFLRVAGCRKCHG